MPRFVRTVLATSLLIVVSRSAAAQTAGDRAGIDAFNRALADATRRMDNAASLALWADDGVSLMPSASPVVGKKAIGDFFASVIKQIAGSRMERFDMRCFDVHVSGPLATEWCVEHQVVHLANGDTFDGWGKMSFVLQRGSDGTWRLAQEMWVQGQPADSLRLKGG